MGSRTRLSLLFFFTERVAWADAQFDGNRQEGSLAIKLKPRAVDGEGGRRAPDLSYD